MGRSMALILLVEDDGQVRKMVRQMLERAGHEVSEAADGRTVNDLFREKTFDLIITDIFMPQKNGLETISAIRKEFPAVKIIAISGGARGGSFDFLPIARSLGAAKALKKPFSRDEMLAAVEEVLAEKKQPTE